jgi:hypothetical protein
MNLIFAEELENCGLYLSTDSAGWIRWEPYSPKLWYLTKTPFHLTPGCSRLKVAVSAVLGSSKKLVIVGPTTRCGAGGGRLGWQNLQHGGQAATSGHSELTQPNPARYRQQERESVALGLSKHPEVVPVPRISRLGESTGRTRLPTSLK